MTSTSRWCLGRTIIAGVSASAAASARRIAAPAGDEQHDGRKRDDAVSGGDEGPLVHSAAFRRRRASTRVRASSARIRISATPANKSGEAEHRQRQRPQQFGRDRRSAAKRDRLALVERAPPQHRIMDDRQVDRADQPEQRRHPPLAAALALGRGKPDVAEVEEEQDQHRRQPPVPFPPRAPRRAAPDRPGGEAQAGEQSRPAPRPRARRPRRAGGATRSG